MNEYGKELFFVYNWWGFPHYDKMPSGMSDARRNHYMSSEKFWNPKNFFELKKFMEKQDYIIKTEHDAFMREAYPNMVN